MRALSIGYLVFLTILLLSADPARVICMPSGLPWLLKVLLPAAHFLSFLMLAVLVLSTRWPVPRWAIVLTLMLYAGMTEIIQGFFPPRTPELMDWIQDLSGIAVGTACCWAAAVIMSKLLGSRRSRREMSSRPSDDWEALQKVVYRSVVVEPSWWI
jgi:VanZ family protein